MGISHRLRVPCGTLPPARPAPPCATATALLPSLCPNGTRHPLTRSAVRTFVPSQPQPIAIRALLLQQHCESGAPCSTCTLKNITAQKKKENNQPSKPQKPQSNAAEIGWAGGRRSSKKGDDTAPSPRCLCIPFRQDSLSPGGSSWPHTVT